MGYCFGSVYVKMGYCFGSVYVKMGYCFGYVYGKKKHKNDDDLCVLMTLGPRALCT